MKKVWKHMTKTVFALAMILLVAGTMQTKVQAAEPTFWSDEYQFMFCPEWDCFGLVPGNLKDNAKITVSSSNKKIATVEWDKEQKTAWVRAKKVGSVKVTIKIKQDGKTYKKVTRMTWVKYKNPLKSVKIGAKKYPVKYFDKNTSAAMKKLGGKKKVYVKLKPGYKLTGLGFSRGGKYKSIKNGSKISFTEKGNHNTVLFINYKDPKGKFGTLRLFAKDSNFAY